MTKKNLFFRLGPIVFLGGCLLPSFFLYKTGFADTITLKNGKELKGLVVEQHADRIILSTENGEVPIFLKGIRDIKYDEPAQNFMKVGKAYEAENKLGEALAYYEKALEVNPNFEEAKVASTGVRNRFWAMVTEGPRSEMEKQQLLYDSWGKGKAIGGTSAGAAAAQGKDLLREGMGIVLAKKGDWVFLDFVDTKKTAGIAGLKKMDRLVAVDGQSLRYLSVEVVRKNFSEPRYSNFVLEFERDCFVRKEAGQKALLKDLGVKLKMTRPGLVIASVVTKSAADLAGLKKSDLLTHMNGLQTRYMPLKKAVEIAETTDEDKVVFTVRRTALLARP